MNTGLLTKCRVAIRNTKSRIGLANPERFWMRRNWQDAKPNDAHPLRKLLASAVTGYFPTSYMILEVGCGNGDNLEALRLSGRRLYGVDFNPSAVRTAQARMWSNNIQQADAASLPYSDKYMDVTFTSAVLVCIPPEKISEVMYELVRVSRRGLILFESHGPYEIDRSYPNTTYYTRRYEQFMPPDSQITYLNFHEHEKIGHATSGMIVRFP